MGRGRVGGIVVLGGRICWWKVGRYDDLGKLSDRILGERGGGGGGGEGIRCKRLGEEGVGVWGGWF